MDQHKKQMEALLNYVIPFEHVQIERPTDLGYWCINCDNDLPENAVGFCTVECEEIYTEALMKEENLFND